MSWSFGPSTDRAAKQSLHQSYTRSHSISDLLGFCPGPLDGSDFAVSGLTARVGKNRAAVNTQLAGLSTSSNPAAVRSAARSTTSGPNTMSNELNADATALRECPALNSTDSQTVADAFDTLANGTNRVLSTLMGKHSPFAQFGGTAPITSALRSLEGSVDGYSFALTAAAPSQSKAISSDQGSLDASLSNAITVYEQLCIPSPLYPTIPPVCVSP